MNPSPTWFICNLHQLLWLRLYRPALRSPIHHALYLIFFKLEIYLVYLQIVAHHSLQGYYLLFIPTFLQAFNWLEITLIKRALYDMFLCLLLLTWMAQGKAAFSRIVHALTDRTWDRAIGENKRDSSSQILPIKSAAHTSARKNNSVVVRP
jgi:hypothetical protein